MHTVTPINVQTLDDNRLYKRVIKPTSYKKSELNGRKRSRRDFFSYRKAKNSTPHKLQKVILFGTVSVMRAISPFVIFAVFDVQVLKCCRQQVHKLMFCTFINNNNTI